MESPYTEDQINRYLEHVCLPPQYRCTVSSKPTLDYDFLKTLHVSQICCFPYENLSLHYSKEHQVNLDPARLYEKYISNGLPRGRGGYCMEGNIFFKHILVGLGFDVYTTGARVRPRANGIPQGDYLGWVHCVNLVTLSDGTQYVVDVAFGGDGATKPVPLEENRITRNIGAQDMRLVRDFIPGQSRHEHGKQKQWLYQCRNGPEKPWHSFYAFTELEFLQQDFEVMNYFTSTCKTTGNFQTSTVLVVKFLRREAEIYGKIMLINGELKLNDTGRTKLVKTCKTEQERVNALDEYFGIKLTEQEMEGVKGLITELKES